MKMETQNVHLLHLLLFAVLMLPTSPAVLLRASGHTLQQALSRAQSEQSPATARTTAKSVWPAEQFAVTTSAAPVATTTAKPTQAAPAPAKAAGPTIPPRQNVSGAGPAPGNPVNVSSPAVPCPNITLPVPAPCPTMDMGNQSAMVRQLQFQAISASKAAAGALAAAPLPNGAPRESSQDGLDALRMAQQADAVWQNALRTFEDTLTVNKQASYAVHTINKIAVRGSQAYSTAINRLRIERSTHAAA